MSHLIMPGVATSAKSKKKAFCRCCSCFALPVIGVSRSTNVKVMSISGIPAQGLSTCHHWEQTTSVRNVKPIPFDGTSNLGPERLHNLLHNPRSGIWNTIELSTTTGNQSGVES